ncbi:MAG: SHOCT domain-containing protein [Phycisphaerales bacterium]|nr:SHOCT domain-containing protein [Phycisphaerales bacterium]
MPNADLLTQILALTGLLAVLIGAGYLLVRFVKKRLADAGDDQPFTLQDLREMKARGEITEREYETMRAAIVGEMSARPPRTPLPKPKPPPAPEE